MQSNDYPESVDKLIEDFFVSYEPTYNLSEDYTKKTKAKDKAAAVKIEALDVLSRLDQLDDELRKSLTYNNDYRSLLKLKNQNEAAFKAAIHKKAMDLLFYRSSEWSNKIVVFLRSAVSETGQGVCFKAMENGEYTIAKVLIRTAPKPFDLTIKNDDHKSMIDLANEAHQSQIFKLLNEMNPQIKVTPQNCELLIWGIIENQGTIENFKKLLDVGNINRISYDNKSLIQYAAEKKRFDIIELLLERGHGELYSDNEWIEVLCIAIERGHQSICQSLVQILSEDAISSFEKISGASASLLVYAHLYERFDFFWFLVKEKENLFKGEDFCTLLSKFGESTLKAFHLADFALNLLNLFKMGLSGEDKSLRKTMILHMLILVQSWSSRTLSASKVINSFLNILIENRQRMISSFSDYSEYQQQVVDVVIRLFKDKKIPATDALFSLGEGNEEAFGEALYSNGMFDEPTSNAEWEFIWTAFEKEIFKPEYGSSQLLWKAASSGQWKFVEMGFQKGIFKLEHCSSNFLCEAVRTKFSLSPFSVSEIHDLADLMGSDFPKILRISSEPKRIDFNKARTAFTQEEVLLIKARLSEMPKIAETLSSKLDDSGCMLSAFTAEDIQNLKKFKKAFEVVEAKRSEIVKMATALSQKLANSVCPLSAFDANDIEELKKLLPSSFKRIHKIDTSNETYKGRCFVNDEILALKAALEESKKIDYQALTFSEMDSSELRGALSQVAQKVSTLGSKMIQDQQIELAQGLLASIPRQKLIEILLTPDSDIHKKYLIEYFIGADDIESVISITQKLLNSEINDEEKIHCLNNLQFAFAYFIQKEDYEELLQKVATEIVSLQKELHLDLYRKLLEDEVAFAESSPLYASIVNRNFEWVIFWVENNHFLAKKPEMYECFLNAARETSQYKILRYLEVNQRASEISQNVKTSQPFRELVLDCIHNKILPYRFTRLLNDEEKCAFIGELLPLEDSPERSLYLLAFITGKSQEYKSYQVYKREIYKNLFKAPETLSEAEMKLIDFAIDCFQESFYLSNKLLELLKEFFDESKLSDQLKALKIDIPDELKNKVSFENRVVRLLNLVGEEECAKDKYLNFKGIDFSKLPDERWPQFCKHAALLKLPRRSVIIGDPSAISRYLELEKSFDSPPTGVAGLAFFAPATRVSNGEKVETRGRDQSNDAESKSTPGERSPSLTR